MSFLRACTTRRRAAPRRQLLRRRPRVRESGPREDVARPCNAIDAAVLVVPWPAPSLSTHEHHCKSAAPGAASVRKEPLVVLSRAIDLSHFAGRAAPGPRAGRPSPALHRMERRLFCLVRDVSASPKAACSRQRIARSPPPAALPDAAQRWRGAAAPLQQLLRRGAARRRATRPFRGRMDDCSYSLSRMRRSGTARCPRPLPGPRTCYRTRRAQKNATRTGARARQHDESPYTHGARAKRGPRASHTHYEHTTSATRRPAREKHTAHTPNSKMRPRAFRIRRARIAARATAQPSD